MSAVRAVFGLALVAVVLAAFPADEIKPCFDKSCIAPAQPSQMQNRPQLLPYNNTADPTAVVVTLDKVARFTVLTDHLIRMEYAKVAGRFEDRASLAVLNRKLPVVPKFTHTETNGVLKITTAAVELSYTIGKEFASDTLSVQPVGAEKASDLGFPGWQYGDSNKGNLLGTIRGLDGQGATPLDCKLNAGIQDNGEYNHCEWGLVSRDGWVVYDDSLNAFTDENDWWSTAGHSQPPAPPTPGLRNCSIVHTASDAASPNNAGTVKGAVTQAQCCAACEEDNTCTAYVWETDKGSSGGCWPLKSTGGLKSGVANRLVGLVGPQSGPGQQQQQGPQFSDVKYDLYGFFHGWKFTKALYDYQLIGGKAIMVPKQAMGVWWSRWYDLNNYDVRKVVDDYESRQIPLDVFVIDMDWHKKDDWSGFTFDPHIFPFAADDMGYLNKKGLIVSLNLHDNSGVNDWDALFPQLLNTLGGDAGAKKVAMNLVNASVAYAVEDIVLGDLLNDKHVGFWWIDWQQGGSQGGMTGDKQNPTIWLAHLRCTDRHRVGDDTRGMVLARWGGMGHHRYQVGFSGDVAGLTWSNLAYQPYFSATAANVLFPSWSHDIEGAWDDQEMYTRWLQVGAFSGTMRSHERGMSAGGCANTAGVTPATYAPNSGTCSLIAPWNVGPKFVEANRGALLAREELLPYIYTAHRSLFDVGVGIMQPLYYQYPKLDGAYRMTAKENAQYFFGPDIMVAPITAPAGDAKGDPSQALAEKSTWMPPGEWYDVLTGKVTSVTAAAGEVFTRGYTLNEIPTWIKAGALIPYLPLKSLPTMVGVAQKQWDFLGFRILPGSGSTASTAVYEDDGSTTAYLTKGAFVWTHCNVSKASGTTTVDLLSVPASDTPYATFPKTRAYQFRLPNALPPSKISVQIGSGAAVDVPCVQRWACKTLHHTIRCAYRRKHRQN